MADCGVVEFAQFMADTTRKANIRLAIILGLVALGFYLLMIFFNPL